MEKERGMQSLPPTPARQEFPPLQRLQFFSTADLASRTTKIAARTVMCCSRNGMPIRCAGCVTMIHARVQASGASESDGARAAPGYCPCEQAPRVVVAKQDDTPAPTFASALLTRQLDDFMDYLGALATTMRGILASEATDKGAQIAQALDDFRGAVLGALQQAGIEITEKRALIPPALEMEMKAQEVKPFLSHCHQAGLGRVELEFQPLEDQSDRM
jgi:hypothetical protein